MQSRVNPSLITFLKEIGSSFSSRSIPQKLFNGEIEIIDRILQKEKLLSGLIQLGRENDSSIYFLKAISFDCFSARAEFALLCFNMNLPNAECKKAFDLVKEVAANGKLPVVLFTAGGIATPADAALMMQMGADGVFIGSGIFKSGDPKRRAEACVKATTFYNDPKVVGDASRGLGEAMVGINVADLPAPHRLSERGW